VKTTFCPQFYIKAIVFLKNLRSRNTWKNFVKTQKGGVNQNGGFQLSYFLKSTTKHIFILPTVFFSGKTKFYLKTMS
jgi:hypothetical protein